MVSRDMEDLEEEDRNRPVAFTLTVYSPATIELMEHPPKHPFSAQVNCPNFNAIGSSKNLYRKADGTFTSRTSGGNPTHRTFMHNPQYRLRLQQGVSQGSRLLGFRMILEASKSVAIKATIVWGGGQRVTE